MYVTAMTSHDELLYAATSDGQLFLQIEHESGEREWRPVEMPPEKTSRKGRAVKKKYPRELSERVITAYNGVVDQGQVNWPRCMKVTIARRALIRRVFDENKKAHSDPDTWFGLLFQTAAKSRFLSGKSDSVSKHRGWKANLDFLLKKHVEIIEGKYDG